MLRGWSWLIPAKHQSSRKLTKSLKSHMAGGSRWRRGWEKFPLFSSLRISIDCDYALLGLTVIMYYITVPMHDKLLDLREIPLVLAEVDNRTVELSPLLLCAQHRTFMRVIPLLKSGHPASRFSIALTSGTRGPTVEQNATVTHRLLANEVNQVLLEKCYASLSPDGPAFQSQPAPSELHPSRFQPQPQLC